MTNNFSNAINSTIGASNSGQTNTLTVTNPSNTASSQAQVITNVGGATAGDPFQTFTVTGATSWSQGIDNSVSDNFTLSASTSLGTTDVLQVGTNGTLTNVLGDINVIRSSTGRINVGISNSNNAAGSSSCLPLNVQSGGGDPYIFFANTAGSSSSSQFGLDQSDSNAITLQLNPSNSGGAMDGTTVWRMTAGATAAGVGCRTMAFQPCFLAVGAGGTNVTGDGTVFTVGSGGTAWTEVFDQNNNFNTNGTFTAPITGRYFFSACIEALGIVAGHTAGFIQCVGTSRTLASAEVNAVAVAVAATGAHQFTFSGLIELAATNTVVIQLVVSGGTKVVDVNANASNTWFSGYLVC